MSDKVKTTFYYLDGTTSEKEDFSKVLHRKDGPAVEGGIRNGEYWLNDEFLSEQDWKILRDLC